jgi:alpha-beta hydrolase superfamily lysophospholipase
MQLLRFGPSGDELAGCHHLAVPSGPLRGSVLLCPAWGREGQRAHRIFRTLADRLARRGLHVLRFDWHGTGDSSGADEDGHFARWRADLRDAHRELARRSLSERCVWVGARLGATLALQGAAGLPWPPRRVVAWEPVADGGAYLADLRGQQQAHARDYALTMSAPDHDLLGLRAGERLLADLGTLRTAPGPDGAPADTVLLAAPGEDAHTGAWHAALTRVGASVQQRPQALRIDWTSEEAVSAALAPAPVVEVLESAVTEAFA